MDEQAMKVVYTIVERQGGKSIWTRIGVGFVNRDGSITLKLDALPVNGTLQVREWESREDYARKVADRAGESAGEAPPARGRSRGNGARTHDVTDDLV